MNQQEHLFTNSWNVDDKKIIDCETCGFKHVFPIPSKEELNQYYKKNYFKNIKPFNYEEITEEYVEEKLKQIPQTNSYIEIFRKTVELMRIDSTQKHKMLDIGSGNDLLAKYFQLQGWEAFTIEPSYDAARYLERFEIPVFEDLVDRMEALPVNNLSFVNIQFVLEHVAQPRELVKKIYSSLVPGGVVRICVPNDFSEGQLAYQQFFNEQFHWVYLPDHLNYFTYHSLNRLLSDYGLEEVYRTTNFPLEFLLMGGVNYYASNEENNKVGPFIQNFQNAFIQTGREELLTKLYESLANIEMGRSIYLYAIKR